MSGVRTDCFITRDPTLHTVIDRSPDKPQLLSNSLHFSNLSLITQHLSDFQPLEDKHKLVISSPSARASLGRLCPRSLDTSLCCRLWCLLPHQPPPSPSRTTRSDTKSLDTSLNCLDTSLNSLDTSLNSLNTSLRSLDSLSNSIIRLKSSDISLNNSALPSNLHSLLLLPTSLLPLMTTSPPPPWRS